MPTLHLYRDQDHVFRYHFSESARIGRGTDSDVALSSQSVSRAHCEVYVDGGQWLIRDLGSSHGTHINGERIESAPLAEGNRITLGEITAIFHHSAPEQSTTGITGTRSFEKLVAVDDGIHVTSSSLEAVSGPDQGKTWALRRGSCPIGRQESMVALQDPDARPRHCTVTFSRGRAVLVPGTGPTIFDSEPLLKPTPLLDGEDFAVGSTRLRFHQHSQTITPCSPSFGAMFSASEAMRSVFGTLKVVSGHTAPILIQGETGTGKELAARGIHASSGRHGAFVAINCGGVSGGLWESELFGHEKGAFTGADSRRDGVFQQAAHGTLFLDEVGDLPLQAQVKLLRVLGEGEVRRVGGQAVEHPSARIIAASNKDLVAMVRQGTFRADLFFRLTVFQLTLPPLRERPEDIPYLTRHFLQQLNPNATLSPGAMRLLKQHTWPGNVRELRQVLMRALSCSTRIVANDIVFYSIPTAAQAHSTVVAHTLSRTMLSADFLQSRHSTSLPRPAGTSRRLDTIWSQAAPPKPKTQLQPIRSSPR